MLELNTALDMLCGHSFSLSAKTGPIYKIVLKALIDRLLADPLNYTIYVSMDASTVPQHQELIPANNLRVIYTPHNIEPHAVGVAGPSIYLYQSSPGKITPVTQTNLLESIRLRPNLRYIYIGSANGFTSYTRLHLFRYHWIVPTGTGWSCGISERYLRWIVRQRVSKMTRSQQRRQKDGKSVNIYRFFAVLDNTTEQIVYGRYDKKVIKAKKKPTPKPKPVALGQSTPAPITQIQYVYVNESPANTLLMPDGSRVNYNSIVKQYADPIEI